ncbi:MAG: thiamine diphosphokinase [Acholeplasmatales bacterium]|nr:thiamine diphosphokinase [Acholeplasmatales bacterium]
MKAIIVCGQNVTLKNYDLTDAYIVGVDLGAYMLAKAGIEMDLALGDFDTAGEKGFIKAKKYAKNVKKLNPIKDDTDTFDAIEEIYYTYSEIIVLGGLQGKRIEHLVANICALKKYPNVKFIDDYSEMEIVSSNKVFKKDKYKFISFFPLKDSTITLKGFKYSGENIRLDLYNPLGVSNEIVDEMAYISCDGEILCIKSMEDQR